jgi:hypothetical protein
LAKCSLLDNDATFIPWQQEWGPGMHGIIFKGSRALISNESNRD